MKVESINTLGIIDDIKELRNSLLKKRLEEKGEADFSYAEGVIDISNELIKRHRVI